MSEITSKVLAGVLAALVLALVCTSLLVAGQRTEARRSRDAALSEVARLTAANATLLDNVGTLQAGIDAQNRAVADLTEAARIRQDAGTRALQTAQARTRELLAQNNVLHEVIRTTKPETCDATFDAARGAL